MPPVMAPTPLIHAPLSAVPIVSSPSSIYHVRHNNSPPPRLMSPIQLSPSAIRPPPIISKPLFNVPSKRRGKPTSYPPRRRRPLPRVDCRLEPVSHPFDQLPWISALEVAPDLLNPWDIADLSQISDPLPATIPPSGPGPVRRRKTSLRSNPLAPTPTPTATSQLPDDSAHPCPAGSIAPFRDTSVYPGSTPRSRFIPSRVLFRNLMPTCDFHNDEPNNCTFTPLYPR
jgi:hypothetical protein